MQRRNLEQHKDPTEFEDLEGNNVELEVERDDQGRVTEVTIYEKWFGNRGSGEKKQHDAPTTTKFEYDAEGNIIKETMNSPFQSTENKRKYVGGLLVEDEFSGFSNSNWGNTPKNGFSHKRLFEYDNKKRLAKVVDDDGSGTNIIEYEYDQNGRKVGRRRTEEDTSGETLTRFIDRYEYDEDGQPFKRISIELDGDGNEVADSKQEFKYDPNDTRGWD